MDRIDGAGHVGRMFVSEDPATNRPPTEITDDWLNAIQEELVSVIVNSGLTLDPNRHDQLLSAIDKIGRRLVFVANLNNISTDGTVFFYVNSDAVGAPVTPTSWDGVGWQIRSGGQVSQYVDTGFTIFTRSDDLISGFSEWVRLLPEGGRYTPTVSNILNVQSATIYPVRWQRVNNEIFGSGSVTITPSAVGPVSLGLTVPVHGILNVPSDASGTCVGNSSTPDSGVVNAAESGNRLQILFNASTTSAVTRYFNFSYTADN